MTPLRWVAGARQARLALAKPCPATWPQWDTTWRPIVVYRAGCAGSLARHGHCWPSQVLAVPRCTGCPNEVPGMLMIPVLRLGLDCPYSPASSRYEKVLAAQQACRQSYRKQIATSVDAHVAAVCMPGLGTFEAARPQLSSLCCTGAAVCKSLTSEHSSCSVVTELECRRNCVQVSDKCPLCPGCLLRQTT